MIRKIDQAKMGKSELEWLTSWFHFSFAEYYNPDNMQFGALRVVNDDLIEPHKGFETHPHNNMEIVTYVVNGELTHADNMRNKRTLKRGEVQYMSAGTGIMHSEMNNGDAVLRLLQIWILPDEAGHAPQYGDYLFPWENRRNRWLHIVSSQMGNAPIKIHQDMNIFVSELKEEKFLEYEILPGRQGYLIVIEGSAAIRESFLGISDEIGEGIEAETALSEETILTERDAAEISSGKITISPGPDAHIILFEMAKA